MMENQEAAASFRLERNHEISFIEKLDWLKKSYSQAHENEISDWAYQKSVANGDVSNLVKEISKRTLAVYDAYVGMQQELGIAPIFDSEMAKSFKRTMGMTHNGILKLQELAKAPKFLAFSKNMESLKEADRKNLWKDLISLPPATDPSYSIAVEKMRTENPQAAKAIEAYFKIPEALLDNDDLVFVRSDQLATLADYGDRETRTERTLLPTLARIRARATEDKTERFLTEINQRNFGTASEEFTAGRFAKTNTYKLGEISEVLNLLLHIDPDLSHIKNNIPGINRREEALERKGAELSSDAIFRAQMTYMTSQHCFFSEIYKLPAEQFNLLNANLDRDHGFTLEQDPNHAIQTTIETGGGDYALFSNQNIRKGRTQEEKKTHYTGLEATAKTTLDAALVNPSEKERMVLKNTERKDQATHIIRGGDLFKVPSNMQELRSENIKAKEYMQKVEQNGYPVVAGISGTTSRHLALAYSLGLLKTQKNQGNLLTAAIGYMVPLRHHSVFEIVTTLKSFNFPFNHSLGLVKGIEDFTREPSFSKDISEKVWRTKRESDKTKSKEKSAKEKEKSAQARAKRSTSKKLG